MALHLALPFKPNPRRHDAGAAAPAAVTPAFVEPPTPVAPQPGAVVPPTLAPPAEKVEQPAKDDGPPPKHVPVAELAAERERRKTATADAAKAQSDLSAANLKLQAFEDEKRTDLEKAQAQATRAMEQVAQANRRAVTSDIRSAAIQADALDPSDVVEVLERRADDFIKDGVVDTAGIEAAVAEVLEKKKHWRKPVAPEGPAVPEKKAPPKPDPSQGPRGGTPAPDWSDPAVAAAERQRLGLPKYR